MADHGNRLRLAGEPASKERARRHIRTVIRRHDLRSDELAHTIDSRSDSIGSDAVRSREQTSACLEILEVGIGEERDAAAI
jgi:hypothetical protein